MTLRRILAALLGLLLAPAARAASPHAYAAPWLAVVPADARIARLASRPPAPLSPNAPGLLLKIDAASWAGSRAAALAAARTLAEHAHDAAWRWGLALALPDAAVPADVRAAEAATVADLWPGLEEALKEARTADLVTIQFPRLRRRRARRRPEGAGVFA